MLDAKINVACLPDSKDVLATGKQLLKTEANFRGGRKISAMESEKANFVLFLIRWLSYTCVLHVFVDSLNPLLQKHQII